MLPRPIAFIGERRRPHVAEQVTKIAVRVFTVPRPAPARPPGPSPERVEAYRRSGRFFRY